MFRYVIFDLDGTLLNTLEDLADAGNWVCRQNGWPEHRYEEYRYFVGRGIRSLVNALIPPQRCTEEAAETALDQFVRRYERHKEDKTRPYEGVAELVQTLNQAGISTAVLTNKPHAVAVEVMEHYFPGLFSQVQGAKDGIALKPDPGALNDLLHGMGAVAEQTLFVGDSDVDMETANNGGLASCGVLWGFRSGGELLAAGADHLAETVEELGALILGTDSYALGGRADGN